MEKHFKILLPVLACWLLLAPAKAQQTVTLEECEQWALQNYPLARQKDLYAELANVNDEILKKTAWPQVSVTGQATYQSEVTKFELPGGSTNGFPEIKPDQYRIGAEVRHVFYDFGYLDARRQLASREAQIQEQQVDVDLQKLKERIGELYGNILLLKENKKILQLRKSDLLARQKQVEAAVESGVSLKTNLWVLQSEVLTTGERMDEADANLTALVKSLSVLTQQPLDTATVFETPQGEPVTQTSVNRPELRLFDVRKSVLAQQNDLLRVENMPRVYWFGQGFFGRPGFNFLNNDFRLYGIIGLGLEWNIAGYYSLGQKRETNELNRELVENQRAVFDVNLQTELIREEAEIGKYQELIAKDREILTVKTKIAGAAASQLENGVITSSEYLVELDAENAAQLNLRLHEIQLAMAKEAYRTTLGY